ncbi:hypothetical protein Tco_0509081 [Tanacetum coccineum]
MYQKVGPHDTSLLTSAGQRVRSGCHVSPPEWVHVASNVALGLIAKPNHRQTQTRELEVETYKGFPFSTHINGDEYVHDDVDEEMKDIEVADIGKDDEEITDAEKAKVEKTKELKGDNKKAKLPLTSSSLSVSSKFGNQFLTYSSDISLTGTLKDTANAEINSLLDIQILQEVPHISSLSILTVPVLVILEPTVLSPIPEIPLVTPVTTLIPPPYVTNLTPVQQQQTTPIPTPPITIVAPVATTVPDPFPAIAQRVSVLEKDVQEFKQVDDSPTILKIIRSQVPATVDAYLGSSLGDALQKVFQKHTEELMQQSSQTDVFRIIKIKKEQAAKEKMPKFSGTPYDEAAKAEFKQKQILFKMMRESKSYKKHLKHKALYDALVLLLIQDEDDLDRVIPYLRKRDRNEDEDPSAGSNQGKRKRSSGKDFEPSKLFDASMKPQNESEPKTESAPKYDWFKQPPMPPTPDPECKRCQIIDDQPEQPWFNNLLSAEKETLTFDELMATPIEFSIFVKDRLKMDKITKAYFVRQENPKGDRCLFDLRKPLPLKGHPGHLTAATEYFFHNDLEYLKSTDLERKYTTSITKTKAARYLEEIVVRRANRQLYKFKECDFVNLHLNDIEDMLLLVVNTSYSISMTEIEIVLEQTQQGASDEVLVSIEGVEELKRIVRIKGVKKEAIQTLRQKSG